MKSESQNARRKVTGDPRATLDSLNLAELRARYVGTKMDAQTFADMEALWHEVDKLRFAVCSADERTRIARAERDELRDQLYAVRAALPRAGGPV